MVQSLCSISASSALRKRSPWVILLRPIFVVASTGGTGAGEIASSTGARTFMNEAATALSSKPLSGPPISSLVPPGQCQFDGTPKSATLLERFPVSHNTAVFRFGLPNPKAPLNLSTCACLLAHAQIGDERVTRPYTPISTNAMVGSFDLLIKSYGAEGKMSRFLHDELNVGGAIEFTHIPLNVKIQAPFDYDHIVMLVGGTGITPMIQALHAILGGSRTSVSSDDTKVEVKAKKQKTCKTKVTVLYGSKTADDILGREVLQLWAKDYEDQLVVVDILSHEPGDSKWNGERGFIDKNRIVKYVPGAAGEDEKLLIMVCGPPPMYKALCGPREEQDKVTGILGDLGYSPEQVYKF